VPGLSSPEAQIPLSGDKPERTEPFYHRCIGLLHAPIFLQKSQSQLFNRRRFTLIIMHFHHPNCPDPGFTIQLRQKKLPQRQ
jgi:hypothetical protein